MNRAWINAMFVLEEQDEKELSNIESYIDKGGEIFFTLDDDGSVLATSMVAPIEEDEWEIMKFCARGLSSGKGAGTLCFKASLEYAEKNGAKRILIVTNHKCTSAVHIYKKFGFKEIPLDKEKFPFERANLALEKIL